MVLKADDVQTRSLTVRVSDSAGDVEAVLLRPDNANWLLVFAHGAGAGMHHPFMKHLAAQLAGCGVATLRYHFPYMQHQRKRPDPPAVLTATVRGLSRRHRKRRPACPSWREASRSAGA
jgi:predicted alpha/beta-hydrolase family hydrolase